MKKLTRQRINNKTAHTFRTPGWKRRFIKKHRRLGVVTVLSVGVLLAFSFQLVLANSLATRGGEINALEQQRAEVLYEIALLEEEAAELQSLHRISSDAERLGLSYNSERFEYVGDLSVAEAATAFISQNN